MKGKLVIKPVGQTWEDQDDRRFDLLAEKEALGEIDSNELHELERLSKKRDRTLARVSEEDLQKERKLSKALTELQLPEEVIEVIASASLRAPIERELRVIRIGPNPRMVVCEYWELESRRTCVVKVGNNRKWCKGMKFVMAEPAGELEFSKPWEYVGKQPRRRGRW